MTNMDLVRHRVLDLHRALLDAERREYERTHGRLSAGAFLEATLRASELAWLAPLTALIVRLDDALEPGAPGADRDAVLEQIRRLLNPDAEGDAFQRRYADALQRDASVVLAHGAAAGALRAALTTPRARVGSAMA